MSEQETAPMPLSLGKLAHIEVRLVVKSDNTQAMRNTGILKSLALVTSAIGQRKPFVGI